MSSANAVAKIFANIFELQASDNNYVIFAGKIRFAAAFVDETMLLTIVPTIDDERALDCTMLVTIMMKLFDAIFVKNISVADM